MTHDIDTFPRDRIRVLDKAAFDDFNHVRSIRYSDFPYQTELRAIESIVPFTQPESHPGKCFGNVLQWCMKEKSYGIAFCYFLWEDKLYPHSLAHMDGLFFEVSPPPCIYEPKYFLYLSLTWDDYRKIFEETSIAWPKEGDEFRPFSLDENGFLVVER